MRSLSCIKYIVHYTALAVMLLLVCSCVEYREIVSMEDEQPSAVLRLSTRSSMSRGDEHYSDDPYGEAGGSLQEEKINRVNLFFFESAESTEAAFFTCELQADATTIADVTVKIPIEKINRFKDEKAYVYALVNIPADTEFPEQELATLKNLKQLWVESGAFVQAGVPQDFVMRGGNEVVLDNSGDETKVTGWISLERLASKIRLFAGIEETIYLDKDGKTIYQKQDESDEEYINRRNKETVEIWDSEPYSTNSDGTKESDVKLYIYNAATRGRIDGFLPDKTNTDKREMLGLGNVDRKDDSKDAARVLNTDVELADYKQDTETGKYMDINRDDYPYTHSVAYYSYPNEWDTSSLYEENQTYVILSLPWRRRDMDDGSGEIYQVCYYQIPINKLIGKENGEQKDRLDPNTYYRIKIHLGMLGSKDLGDPLEVEASYEAVDWSNADVNVNIKGRRYLVVNQKEWVMNNVWTLQIPFSTSHPVVADCYVTYFRYHDIWGTDSNSDGTHDMNEFTKWLEAAGSLPNGQAGEGLITASFGTQQQRIETTDDTETTYTTTYNYTDEKLYYKSEYFKDPYIGYTYYVGHEHPITIQNDFVEFKEYDGMTDEEKNIWKDYNLKYDGINAVYTCTIDEENSVMNFRHPLIQWKGVRENVQKSHSRIQTKREWVGGFWTGHYVTYYEEKTEYTSTFKYYVPELNPRTGNFWDEFSRIEIVIKLKHADWDKNDGLYEETIHITQYPAMYIEVSHNYGSPGNSGNEYVKVNDNHTTSSYWNSVVRLSNFSENASNANPNMYIIHTTQLSEENEKLYEIGDPRTIYYNNNLETRQDKEKNSEKDRNTSGHGYDEPLEDSSDINAAKKSNGNSHWEGYNHGVSYDNKKASAPEYDIDLSNNGSIYNDTKTLYSYYPTDESMGAGSKENFVAPVFRVASSFGVAPVNGRTEMRRRCASYQEAGRPAGRWRLPTKAEVKYIAQLSADGKIPILFGSVTSKLTFGYYWTAQGGMIVNGNGECYDEPYGDPSTDIYDYPAGIMAARCVYDEWYWTQIDGGEFPNGMNAKSTEFKWGDVKKDNTQTQSLIKRLIYHK